MNKHWIQRMTATALSLGLLHWAAWTAWGQALTGLSLGGEVRETLRGQRPGVETQGPISLGQVDIISQNPIGGGEPVDPFTSLPNPNQSFDPSNGQDMSSEDPFSQEPDPSQSFDPSEGQDMSSEDPFNNEPDPGQSFDPSKGEDMGSEDPFELPPAKDSPPIPAPEQTQDGFVCSYVTLLNKPRTFVVGAKGNRLVLCNNPNAKDPTWAELEKFLLADKTDTISYELGTFVCGDFAETLHNNAEKAGFRCHFLAIQLSASFDRPQGIGHALNAFQTSDRGMVYIDCTASMQKNQWITSADKEVDFAVGKDYKPKSLFPSKRQSLYWNSMGTVKVIDAFQE